MTTHLSTTMSFDAAPERVWQMLGDSAYLDSRATAAARFEYDVVDAHGGRTLEVIRALDVDVPAAFRSMVGERVTLHERQEWQPVTDAGERHGTLAVTVAGAPAKVSGQLRMAASANGCVIEMEMDIRVSVPLLGAVAESVIKSALVDVLSAEEAAGQAWLST